LQALRWPAKKQSLLHMKLYCFILPAVLLLAGCHKNKTASVKACGVDNPAAHIPWLKQTIDSIRQKQYAADVTLIRYEGQDYINVQLLYQSCYLCHISTCDGRPLGNEDSTLRKNILLSQRAEIIPLLRINY
jgi:outer membrane murein-binding lipoprotein Lpp